MIRPGASLPVSINAAISLDGRLLSRLSVFSSQATPGEVAAPSRMEQSVELASGPSQVVQRDNADTGELRARNAPPGRVAAPTRPRLLAAFRRQ